MRRLTLVLLAAGAGAVMLSRRGRERTRGDGAPARRGGAVLGVAGQTLAQAATSSRDGYTDAAAILDQYATEAAALASRRSGTARVQAYAEMLEEHHGDAAGRLRLLVAESAPGRSLSGALDGRRQQMIEALESAGEAEFDALFLSQQIAAHEEAIALHERYAAEGDDERLVEHAGEMIEPLRRHLEAAERLQADGRGAGRPAAAFDEATLAQAGGA